MSTKPVISSFNKLAEMMVHKYERYLPTAFDESMSLVEKVNKVIDYLNKTGLLVNEVVEQWNEVMEWVMNDGLTQAISDKLDEMVADGTFDQIINDTLFNQINDKITNRTTVSVWDYKESIPNWETTPQETWDWKPAFQSAVNYLKTVGGGNIFCPSGTYGILSNINLESDIAIVGEWWTTTVIKPLSGANIPLGTGVVQTKDFLPDRNIWNYYEPYPIGLHMGVGLMNITIDGNRSEVGTGNGLCIYGGKWNLFNVAVINASEHGIWTEAGHPKDSTSGDDWHDFLNMHESTAEQVYIVNANKHGWFYRGPNDSYINNIQIKTCGWAGFYQDQGGAVATGGLKIGSLHVYTCDCSHDADGYMVTLASAQADRIYSDSSKKGGVKLYGSASQVNMILAFKNNFNNAGDYYSLKIESSGCMVGQIRDSHNAARTSGTNGGVLWIASTSTRSIVGQLRSFFPSSSTIPSIAVKLDGTGSNVSQIAVENYSSTGSKGLVINATECHVEGRFRLCDIGLQYKIAGRNTLNIMLHECTTPELLDVAYSKSDIVDINFSLTSFRKSRVTETNNLRLPKQDVGYSSSLTIDMSTYNTFVHVAPLTGDITVNAPLNPKLGDQLTLLFTQDNTGTRQVVWNTVFKTNFVQATGQTYGRHTITFLYDGQNWVQIGSPSGWY